MAVLIALEPEKRFAIQRELMQWYRANARQLPWRGVRDPYLTWISEIMLQQTRVSAAIEHYRAFVEKFPTLLALALAPEADVLAAWSGLGYYRRARMMHRAAKHLVEHQGGVLPSTAAELRRLPGIGTYTSAAIASIAFHESVAVVDGNVERVLLRLLGMPQTSGAKAAAHLNAVAQSLVPLRGAGDHNQAMMELGATVCTPRAPRCNDCPLYGFCATRGEHTTLQRAAMRSERVQYGLLTRKVRGTQIVEVLLQQRPENASLMAGMLELPQLTAKEPGGLLQLEPEPLLRVRHAIVGTNYYVEIAGMTARRDLMARCLRTDHLDWVSARDLGNLPLTGLARKVLQRLRLMRSSADTVTPDLPLLIGRGSRMAAISEA